MKSRYLLLTILVTALSIFAAEQSFAQARHEVDVDFTTSYSPIWNDNGSGANSNVSFWRPNITFGWSRVGHHISKGYGNPQGSTMLVRPRTSGAIADPVDYALIWTDTGSGASQDGSVWRPVCRSGYQPLGDVTSSSHAKPTATEMVCLHESALVNANPGNPIWNDAGSGAIADFGSWEINPSTGDQSRGLFFGATSHSRPQLTLWAVRSNTVQPVTQGIDPVEEQFWDSVKNSTQPRDFQSYLNGFPNGKYSALARLKISQFGNPVSTPPTQTNSPNAQFINQWAVDTKAKLPLTVGSFQFTNAASVCLVGCAIKDNSDYLMIMAKTPSLTAQTTTIGQVEQSLKPALLGEYCSNSGKSRNINLGVNVDDMNGSRIGNFWVTPSDCNVGVTTNPTPNQVNTPMPGNSVEDQYWDSVKNSSRWQDFQGYLNTYPNGKYVAIANLKISQIGGPVTTPNPNPISPGIPNPTKPGISSVEDQYWDSVKNSLRVQDYQGYLSSYPNGKFTSLANLKISQLGGPNTTPNPINPGTPNPINQTPGTSSIEEQYWDAIKNSTRAQDYESYLKDYPNGQFTPIARLKLQQIQGSGTPTQPTSNTEDQYWNSISNSQRAQDFQGYLSSFPNGKYAAITRLKIIQLGGNPTPQPNPVGSPVEDQFWNNVKNSNRVQDFQSYLNSFPNGQYTAIARLRINQLNNANPTNPVRPPNKTPTDEDFIRTAQPGSINELSQARRFFVAGDDFSVKQAIAKAIMKELPQLEVALTEQDADFFILCNLTDSTTNAAVTNDSSNANLFGDLIVFTVVSPTNAAQKRIRIQFRQKSGRSFGVFTDTPDVKIAKDFAKQLKKIIQ